MVADVLRLNMFGLKNKCGGLAVPTFILIRLKLRRGANTLLNLQALGYQR